MSRTERNLNQPTNRPAVWLLLAIWTLGLTAPCAHCFAMAQERQAAPAPPPEVPAMPADCPMHAKGNKAPAAPAAPAPPCQEPGSCCLTPGALPMQTPATLEAPPAPSATLAEMPALPLPAAVDVFLHPASGLERSHAPPAFNRPLRI